MSPTGAAGCAPSCQLDTTEEAPTLTETVAQLFAIAATSELYPVATSDNCTALHAISLGDDGTPHNEACRPVRYRPIIRYEQGTDDMTTKHAHWLMLLVFACGPRVEDDHDEQAAGHDEGGADCEDASCSPGPLCGERQLSCAGSLGMGECIDGKCGPVPMNCTGELDLEDTCTEVCAAKGEGVICVENGCEGATAFGYPGPAHLAIAYCGESNSTVLDAVVPIEIACDAPLPFTGEGSFELYQCCCDHPDY